MNEISKVVCADNFKSFCATFSSQACYAEFSTSLILYVSIFQSIGSFLSEKKSKFDILLSVLIDKCFFSEEEILKIKLMVANQKFL